MRGARYERLNHPELIGEVLISEASTWRGINLEGADMRATDCSGANFTGEQPFRYADFRGAVIHGTNFQNASLYWSKDAGR